MSKHRSSPSARRRVESSNQSSPCFKPVVLACRSDDCKCLSLTQSLEHHIDLAVHLVDALDHIILRCCCSIVVLHQAIRDGNIALLSSWQHCFKFRVGGSDERFQSRSPVKEHFFFSSELLWLRQTPRVYQRQLGFLLSFQTLHQLLLTWGQCFKGCRNSMRQRTSNRSCLLSLIRQSFYLTSKLGFSLLSFCDHLLQVLNCRHQLGSIHSNTFIVGLHFTRAWTCPCAYQAADGSGDVSGGIPNGSKFAVAFFYGEVWLSAVPTSQRRVALVSFAEACQPKQLTALQWLKELSTTTRSPHWIQTSRPPDRTTAPLPCTKV